MTDYILSLDMELEGAREALQVAIDATGALPTTTGAIRVHKALVDLYKATQPTDFFERGEGYRGNGRQWQNDSPLFKAIMELYYQ